MSKIGEHFCYAASHYLLSRNRLGRYRDSASLENSLEEFERWRAKDLAYKLNAVLHVPLTGKTLLDFGCGGGQLSFLLKSKGAQKVLGVDVNPEVLKTANRENPHGDSVEFVLGSDSEIPLPSASVDLVACLAVLEHVMDVDSILNQWHRILRPRGSVLIVWHAWHHPDGFYLSSLIPILYAQCIFSERTLARTSARLRRSSVYRPKFWDNLTKPELTKPSSDEYCRNFLNKMSIGSFNKKLRRIGCFQLTEYECHPPSWFPHLRPFLRIPFFREHLSSYVTYVLTKV